MANARGTGAAIANPGPRQKPRTMRRRSNRRDDMGRFQWNHSIKPHVQPFLVGLYRVARRFHASCLVRCSNNFPVRSCRGPARQAAHHRSYFWRPAFDAFTISDSMDAGRQSQLLSFRWRWSESVAFRHHVVGASRNCLGFSSPSLESEGHEPKTAVSFAPRV